MEVKADEVAYHSFPWDRLLVVSTNKGAFARSEAFDRFAE
jgi:hypothetical protein